MKTLIAEHTVTGGFCSLALTTDEYRKGGGEGERGAARGEEVRTISGTAAGTGSRIAATARHRL